MVLSLVKCVPLFDSQCPAIFTSQHMML